jgi:hypothetical protein
LQPEDADRRPRVLGEDRAGDLLVEAHGQEIPRGGCG